MSSIHLLYLHAHYKPKTYNNMTMHVFFKTLINDSETCIVSLDRNLTT